MNMQKDKVSTFLPFLVFEVLEGQIYYFLDKSIQKRVKGDLDKERMLQFFGLWIIWCNLSAHKRANNLIYFGSVHRRRERFKVHIKYSFIDILAEGQIQARFCVLPSRKHLYQGK